MLRYHYLLAAAIYCLGIGAVGEFAINSGNSLQPAQHRRQPSQRKAGERLSNLLIAAVGNGDWAEVRRLLAERADANTRNDQGEPLLTVAANQGYFEIVEGLIAAGA